MTTTLREGVAALPVADEDRTGYNRERSFGTWTDADHNGCNTRSEVLLDEALQAPEVTGRCKLTPGTGRWYSWYDDQYVTSARDLDVDHVVPLAEAWDSGASAWSQERRVAYANDLSDPRHLEAVTNRSNRQKSDKDPAQWMPDEAVYCRYTEYWVIAKSRYGLSVDAAEKSKLVELASGCSDAPLTYTPAP
nr:HNH endonuclease family protein [Streptomyces milbemycinicus]